MKADEANVDMDEGTMFVSAIHESSQGRVRGFGSVLDHKVQPTTRARSNHTSSISGVTNNSKQKTFTDAEVQTMLDDRDRRHAEDWADRKRDMATHEFYISQLFKMMGTQMPTVQVITNSIPTLELPIWFMC